MDNKEIKRANRKALPKFLLVLAASMLIGGFVGYFSGKYAIDALPSYIKAGAEFFGAYIAPWLMLAIAIILPFVSVPLYKNAKKLLSVWDDEDEDISDSVDRKLSLAIYITSTALIIAFFLISATYSGGVAMFDSKATLTGFFVGIASFLAIMAEAILIQQKCVDAAKKTNPEKTASVYDMKFQKKWLDSCDEAERILIGKCAFKAYRATNTVCIALSVILALSALVLETGFLPSLVVCIIWVVNQTVYCFETVKYSKAGNKIL